MQDQGSWRTAALALKQLLFPEEFSEADAQELEKRREQEEEWWLDQVNEGRDDEV